MPQDLHGEREQAEWLIRYFHRQLAANPQDVDLRLKLGLFLIDMGRTPDALPVLLREISDCNPLTSRRGSAPRRKVQERIPCSLLWGCEQNENSTPSPHCTSKIPAACRSFQARRPHAEKR
jgi:hypothetical protein